ncbi:hypothetical protein QBC34DRAFT_460244 [Podospora aff. communis PSN243]|uniref:tyrosinase n=1 Tax=Podospora aff. communis PSN243 TaxID=3040156 RepID=A0AAV9H4Y7_9PEZI|nr:hypothetical protein QBC34DRAFT_460244 [Podospora aff. communis PSN243]
MSIPLPKEPVVVTGIKGPVAPRLEIRDLMQNKPMWYLFLKGLQAFQRVDPKNARSYYSIAGIHGRPYVPYNEVVGRKLTSDEARTVGGYCAHSSIVFATWHRPFLALFEQELQRHVKEEAARIENDTGVYRQAAQDFRLPYWDWALQKTRQPEFWPTVFESDTIKVDGLPILNSKSINPNPLVAFSTAGLTKRDGEDWAIRDSETTKNSDLGINLGQAVNARNTSVSKLMFTQSTWAIFSNNEYIRSQNPSSYFSIEEVHDKIHGAVGGTMNAIQTSAFDPVFWLHHCNIDRLTAIRQAIWPKQYISEKGQQVRSRNFVAQFGDMQNNMTPLKPFWRIAPTAADAVSTAKYDAAFWNSQQVEYTEVFGYTYPETNDRVSVNNAAKFSALVAGRAEKLYPADITPPRSAPGRFSRMAATTSSLAAFEPVTVTAIEATEVEAEAAPVAPTPEFSALEITTTPETTQSHTRDPSDLITANNTYTDWSVNIRATKHILGKPYQIIVFDGDFNPDPARWTSEYNKVDTVAVLGQGEDTACAKCRDDQENDLAVAGVVSLTSALIQDYMEGEIASLNAEDVVPHLKRHLHWRVLVDGVTDLPREEVPGLVVCVSSTTVSFDENGIPRYSTDHTLHPEITDGRPAGLATGEEP